MTYKLEPGLSRIASPLTLVFPNGSKQRYNNGKAVAELVFDKRFLVDKIKAKDNNILITLIEQAGPEDYWTGKEHTFF